MMITIVLSRLYLAPQKHRTAETYGQRRRSGCVVNTMLPRDCACSTKEQFQSSALLVLRVGTKWLVNRS